MLRHRLKRGGKRFFLRQRVVEPDLRRDFLRRGQRGLGRDIAHCAADQGVQFVRRILHFGLGLRFGLQAQLKVSGILRRYRGRGRLGGRFFLAAQLGQRVKTERAAGADLDALERVVVHGVFQRAGRGVGTEVNVKVRTVRGGHSRGRLRGGVLRRYTGCAAAFFFLFQIRRHVKSRVAGRARRFRQRAGQVFDGFLLRLLAEQLRIVGGAFRLALALGGLPAVRARAQELHNIGRGQCKKDHQPHRKQQQHDDVGAGAAAQRQQHRADAAEHAARPKAGLPPAVQHLDDIPCGGFMHRKAGKHDRHAGGHQRQQRHFGHKNADPVAGRHQIREI